MRWGPAARREGPAGYKGEERAGEAAPRDPTAAGDPGPGPGDDCEFKAASFTHNRTHAQIHISTYIHTGPVLSIKTLHSASIRGHVCDKLLQALSSFSVILTRER